jgi:hypothetical protein
MRDAGSVKFPRQERAGFGYAQYERFLQSRLFYWLPRFWAFFKGKNRRKWQKFP